MTGDTRLNRWPLKHCSFSLPSCSCPLIRAAIPDRNLSLFVTSISEAVNARRVTLPLRLRVKCRCEERLVSESARLLSLSEPFCWSFSSEEDCFLSLECWKISILVYDMLSTVFVFWTLGNPTQPTVAGKVESCCTFIQKGTLGLVVTWAVSQHLWGLWLYLTVIVVSSPSSAKLD